MVSISNGIIIMNRGDSFEMPVVINYGTKFAPKYYSLTANDTAYFAIEEMNQPFEHALVRKVFDDSHATEDGFMIKLSSEDTEFIMPGEYTYEIKLVHKNSDDTEFIDTIVPKRKFIIL